MSSGRARSWRRPCLGLSRAPSPNRLTTSPLEHHQAGDSIAAPIRMLFKIENHDVTCLCAIVGLPKRVIVQELPPRDGRARWQFEAFTEGSIGAVLEWLHPALTRSGARPRVPTPAQRGRGIRYL